MTVFKIQNVLGKYSTGSSYPRFTRLGKIWTKLSHVEAHLELLAEAHSGDNREGADRVMDYYRDCWIVEYEIEEKMRLPFPIY